ncbi:LysR family transcriptional regulator [Streptomyces mashuensis]|uniref:LysR family transcriptional regulator n=1 Tax=Streptomyces mashuensis TaxID=33904 RepID=A0A919B975_9ACTN|nr:NAD(P)H-binding protein [Streptomyces mashuensis]GHF65766.1 LysR family transcriptional regulator [Streptomyces mashuensis]
MKIAVIGGTGRIGSRIVEALTTAGHDATPHARSTGVDLLTGEGLAPAPAGADAVVDATQSPTADDASADFFRTATGNLLTAAEHAGVRHAVLLSIVGVDRVPGLGYYRAKVVQEELFATGPVPYSLVRATQFFEYIEDIMSWTTEGDTIRLPTTLLQPVAAADVAQAVAGIATGTPLHGIREVAGPDVLPLDELGRITLAATRDNSRTVLTDDAAGPFALASGDALTATQGAHVALTDYRSRLAG